MLVSIIVAHPSRTSFNRAIADTTAAALRQLGHSVQFHDLYEEGFDPILTPAELADVADLPPLVKKHCEELRCAEGLILVHPNWWGQPPAILKGWVDRVLRPHLAYEFDEGDAGEGVPKGLLHIGQAIVFNTSNTKPQREIAVFGDPLETLWTNCILQFCGVKSVCRRTFSVVITSTEEERRRWLEEAAALVTGAFGAS